MSTRELSGVPAKSAEGSSSVLPMRNDAVPTLPSAASPRLDSTLPARVDSALAGPGAPLDPATRSWAERQVGHEFSQVRVHADDTAAASAASLGATAYSVGRDIVFGVQGYRPDTTEGRALLLHELAHVSQDAAGRGEGDPAMLEAEADRAAGRVPTPTPAVPRLRVGGRVVHRKGPAGPAPDVEFTLILALDPLSAAEAKKAFEAFRKMKPAQRKKALESHFKAKTLAKLLQALPKYDAINSYPDELREMLRFVEEASTREASGQSDKDMAAAQAKFQRAEAEKAAKVAAAAKAPKGVAPKPPTAAEIEAARKERVAETSIAPVAVATWDAMDAPTKSGWTKRAGKAVDAVVALATKSYPELKLTKAHFRADFPGVEKRGAGVLAFEGGTPAAPVAVFGFEFVRAAEADPGYVLGVVVHELFGHREYGPYGSEYHLALYDLAQKKMPGYVKPAGGTPARTAEKDAYAYQETEIYALLRSLPYSKSIAPKDAGKGLVGYDPAQWAKDRIGIIKSQWEPKLAVAIVRGLYMRLLLDPRISGPAINAFRDGVKVHFSAAEAKEILK